MSKAAITILAFDYGLKRLGVAVGQTVSKTASPLNVIPMCDGEPRWSALDAVFRQWQPERLVVGMPTYRDGAVHRLTHVITRFGESLRKRYCVPVEYIDERLSSSEAAHANAAARHGLDACAAQVILQTWLNESASGGIVTDA